MYSPAVLQGVGLFAPKFYLDRIVTLTILSTGRLETLCYPTAKTAFFAFPRFDTILDWSVTNRQIDMP